MQRMIGSLIVLTVLGVQAGAEPMVAGQVRLASGEPVAGAHVRLFDLAGLRSWVGATTDETGSFALPVGALPGAAVQPEGFHLGENYPNPFNPSTIIPYYLPTAMPVRLEVFNILGQRIATLVDGEQASGFHTVRWDGTNAAGQAVAAGIYLYRLRGEGVQATQSMVLIDGQAGIPGGSSGALPMADAEAPEAASVYGLTVSGPGLIPFVDPAFDLVAGPVDLVVEASAGLARAKTASACGILGDVDANERVDVFDALFVAVYSGNPSTVMPNHGDISQGDVNADGRIDFTDVYLIASWLSDPSDPTLPAGIGEATCSDDRDVLVALYEATNGDNWEHNTNWLSDEPLGEWYGVTTDDNGRVTSLWLRNNQLSGRIPPELGNLTHLERLNLDWNNLSGRIPPELGNLTNLQSLWISGSLFNRSELSGPLPWSLVRLTNLESLDLSKTQLCAPTDASFQTWLQGIWLKDGVVNCAAPDRTVLVALYEATDGANWTNNTNWLSDRPLNEWHGVTTDANEQVTHLELGENRLSGALPTSLGDLTHLERLWIGHNQLSGALPSSLVNLTDLRELRLNDTQLCAPTDAGFQMWLQGIETKQGVVNCQPPPTVSIPDANLRAVIEDNLGKARGAPITPAEMASLTRLEAPNKNISEVTGLEFAINLTWLNLGVEPVDGSLVNSNTISDLSPLSGLTNLQELRLPNNRLSGALPAWLGNLNNLEVLLLYGNNELSGALPASLVDLTNLERLVLENTQLCAPRDADFQRWLEGIDNKQGVVDCPEVNPDRPTEEGDRAQLAEMRREIDALIGDAVGASIEDCRYMGLGDKPCGGPWEYIVYSVSSTDSMALAERVTAYNAFEEEMNIRYWYDSDCAYEMPPMLVYRDGRCLAYEEDFRASLAGMRWEFVEGVEIEPVVFPEVGVGFPPRTYSLWGIPPGLSFDAATRTLSGTPTVAGTYEMTCTLEGESSDFEAEFPYFSTVFTVIIVYSNRTMLVALYEATDGENWKNNTNWLSEKPLDEWFGVTTDENGRVTELRLSENRLSGVLPSSLGDLTNLQWLDFFDNELSGALPSSLVNLTDLKWLNLSNTQLCAPTDAAFQTWLEGIDDKKGVVNCGEDNRESNFRFVEGAEIAPVVFPEVGGGEPPLTYSMSGIPPGLSFDGDTRMLSGTPTVAGTYEMTYRVEDSTGASAEMTFIVIVEPSGG